MQITLERQSKAIALSFNTDNSIAYDELYLAVQDKMSAIVNGGKFFAGFVASVVGKAFTIVGNAVSVLSKNIYVQGLTVAAAGGLGSRLAGGSFELGFLTAGLAFAVNQVVTELAQEKNYAITDAERQLVADGDIQGFWESRSAAGDPVARAGLASLNPSGGAIDYLFGGTSINNRLQAFANVYADGVLNIDLVRTELANAHIRFTDNDTSGIIGLLNPEQIAEYHHQVFRDHNLPSTAFGGTPFTGAVREASFTRAIWCRGCDTR